MAAPEAGMLQSLYVAEGDTVTSGAPLFSMDAARQQAAVREARMKLEQGQALLADARQGKRPTEIAALEADLKQAQAALVLAVKTYERQRTLFQNKTISAQEFDSARSQARQAEEKVTSLRADIATAQQGSREQQITAAEANVKALSAAVARAEWDLSQTTQSAPQAALVFDNFFRPGEFVAAGRPVVSLLPPGRVRARVFLSEKVVGSVELNTSATVSYDGAPAPVTGWISFISPQAEFTPPVIYSREMREKLSFLVEISFDENAATHLHPGQPVDVDIPGVAP
jgi:HlyD family secretion protein